MEKVLGKFSSQIYAVLRIVAGLLFAQHGAQKLLGALGGEAVNLRSLMGLAGVIELVGGLLIAVGLFGSLAAFIASGEMAAAYFKAHAPQALFPVQNHGDLPILFCFVFLYVASMGSGIWSVDAMRGRKK
jgi:putative oxidoreductase